MRPLLIVPSGILAIAAVPSAASPDRMPYLCDGPDVSDTMDDGPGPTAMVLVGTYQCSAEGLTVNLRLDADGWFEERIEGEGICEAGDFTVPAKPSTLSGRWEVKGWNLHLFQRPTRAPFKQRARAVDPEGHAVIVPFGIAGAVLRRVTTER